MSEALDILIVDDNEDDVFLLEQAFRKANSNHRLQIARDGREAIGFLEDDISGRPFPDLMLLDLNMPRMNGFETLKWIRQDRSCSRLMVHVLTASARSADVEMAYELGANSFTVKPTRLYDLVDFVGALCHWHRFIAVAAKPEMEHSPTEPMKENGDPRLKMAEAAHF